VSALEGKRVVLLGASAGIGRALAVRLVSEGAQVVMAARREAELAKTVAEAAGGRQVCTDITQAADCERLAETARENLGGIDLLVSSVGAAPLRMMAETGPEEWRKVFDTNVVGFHQVVRSCLDVLAPNALVAALSSESVDQPRAALGAYVASKVALERAMSSWRLEQPALRFCRIRVGQTFPTDFGSDFDPGTLDRAITDWAARGLAPPEYLTPEDAAGAICGVLAVAAQYPGVSLDELTVRPSAAAASFNTTLGQ
jgi:NAD(P)-dependent dehydrogenase (short-subunit alcohol dehydrogenase family)